MHCKAHPPLRIGIHCERRRLFAPTSFLLALSGSAPHASLLRFRIWSVDVAHYTVDRTVTDLFRASIQSDVSVGPAWCAMNSRPIRRGAVLRRRSPLRHSSIGADIATNQLSQNAQLKPGNDLTEEWLPPCDAHQVVVGGVAASGRFHFYCSSTFASSPFLASVLCAADCTLY